MSTRSNIIILTPDNQAHQFYHHCDGYLSGVGEELRGMLNESANYEDLLEKLATPDEYGDYYRDEGKFDQKLAANGLHADIEFLYVVKNNKLYYMEIWKSKDFEELRTYKELIDYICINKHEIDLTKKVTDKGYIYTDNNETTKTEVKTMNYTEEKTRIENEIKRLQSELETLEKRSQKEEWKKSLVEKFKEFIESMDPETAAVEIRALRDDHAFILNLETYFFNEPEKAKEPEKPENKIVVAPVPKLNETTEEKPVKMKMSLDELINGMK